MKKMSFWLTQHCSLSVSVLLCYLDMTKKSQGWKIDVPCLSNVLLNLILLEGKKPVCSSEEKQTKKKIIAEFYLNHHQGNSSTVKNSLQNICKCVADPHLTPIVLTTLPHNPLWLWSRRVSLLNLWSVSFCSLRSSLFSDMLTFKRISLTV